MKQHQIESHTLLQTGIGALFFSLAWCLISIAFPLLISIIKNSALHAYAGLPSTMIF
jgi:hypothetical protein